MRKFKNIWMIYIKRYNKENREKKLMKNSMKNKVILIIIKRWMIIIHFVKKERANLKN